MPTNDRLAALRAADRTDRAAARKAAAFAHTLYMDKLAQQAEAQAVANFIRANKFPLFSFIQHEIEEAELAARISR